MIEPIHLVFRTDPETIKKITEIYRKLDELYEKERERQREACKRYFQGG